MSIVLVLDANQRSALAVTRSLGHRSIHVLTADEGKSALAGKSRFSAAYVQYPSPKNQTTQFIEYLQQVVKSNDIDTILPMTELTTMLLLGHRSEFKNVEFPFADPDDVNQLADKCQLMKIAESMNIPTPETRYINDHAELQPAIDSLTYPMVLKPGKSWLLTNGIWQRHAVRIAHNLGEVRHITASDPAFRDHPYLLQECVTGTGQGIFALYDRGKPVAFFAHRRLREKPPSGGVSVLSESIPVDPLLLSHAKGLLDSVKWHGVAMVEFKVNPRTQTPYLMEINTRFWGSLQLAIDAGVDFPWMLYNVAHGRSPERITDYRLGVRSRWLLGDIDSLYLTLRSKRISFREKLAAIGKFIQPHPFSTRHEINRWYDFEPFVYELREYMRALFG